MLVSTDKLFEHAKKNNCAIPAPDFVDSGSAKAFVEVAEQLKCPVILSYAEVHNDILSLEEAFCIGKFYGERATVPVALHLDHGMSFEITQQAVKLGFTSVMIDASVKPFKQNIAISKEVAEFAHKHNVVVEAEIGHVGSGVNYENHSETDSIYTNVSDAIEFVKQTNVDSLAVSIGTAHGIYKGEPKLDFDRLQELSQALTIPLVLHGGSSSGDENLRRCATSGISKINIFTDLMVGAFDNIKDAKDYLELQENAQEGMKKVLRHYYEVFMTEQYK